MTDEKKSLLCCKCANCCKSIIIRVARPSIPKEIKADKDFLMARGLKILKENDKCFFVSIPLQCSQLNVDEGKNGGSVYFCNIYNNRPDICRKFDGRLVPAWHDLNCMWRGV